MKIRYVLLSAILLIGVLSSFRLFWMNQFHQSQSDVEQGTLILDDWDQQNNAVLILDGEWEFYPSQFLMSEKNTKQKNNNRTFAEVPGNWAPYLEHNDEQSSFGYGTYRLKIKVNSKQNIHYSLYVPSVRSASELYVNGKKIASSGKIGRSATEATSKNLPYTATFQADENGEIDIVLQASNFQDSRNSGIARSIKFGTEQAITKERNISLAMQVLSAVIFIIHALYAIILYILGSRDKKLIYFSLLLFSITIVTLMSSDEKLFHLLFDVNYMWDFRIANGLAFFSIYCLLKSFDHDDLPYWRYLNPITFIVFGITLFILLFLTPGQIISLYPYLIVIASISLIITFTTIIRKLYENIRRNLLLFYAIIIVVHHFSWYLYWRDTGVTTIHYPFDLVLATGTFASIWLHNYFSVHRETKQLAKELKTINKHKDEFLIQTSHEFKNPLHGMINFSQTILQREPSLHHESVRELEMIRSVGRRLSLLLNDLLDEASLKDGNPRLNRKPIAIQSIITGVIDLLKFSIQAKPLQIVNKIPTDFPMIDGDKNRMIQIFYNLLHNATKYTNEGEICIEGQVDQNKVIISITDTGRGIDEQFLKQIFLPYEQEETIQESKDGYGLGLKISKQLVELHGGTLEVSSKLNVGSTFTMTLPIAKDDTPEVNEPNIEQISFNEINLPDYEQQMLTPENEEVAATTLLHRSEAYEILVVDDDPINLNVMNSILTQAGFLVTTVLDGKKALELIDQQKWSLVIADIMMPEMSGFELTEEIRKRYSFTELPILLLTARNTPQDIQTGFLCGANDYLIKPVEMLELKSRVNALITVKNSVAEQLRLKSAWLQAQIQPHFLFNTINSIISLSTVDIDKMNDLLLELSDYLRGKYQFNDIEELIPIEEELNIVESYVNIEQMRFGDRLNVLWETDYLPSIKVPFLSIQPLVENAIQHGIMKRAEGGQLILRILDEGEHVKICVEDDGVGIERDRLDQLLNYKNGKQTSIGLINTNKRLSQHFNTQLQIKSEVDRGTTVSFSIPKQA